MLSDFALAESLLSYQNCSCVISHIYTGGGGYRHGRLFYPMLQFMRMKTKLFFHHYEHAFDIYRMLLTQISNLQC